MTAVPADWTAQRYVSRGDAQIAVYEQGNPHGPTVVLAHGWPDSHIVWDNVVPLLVDRFRVITYDNRGAGRLVGARFVPGLFDGPVRRRLRRGHRRVAARTIRCTCSPTIGDRPPCGST